MMCERCGQLEQALIAFTRANLHGPTGLKMISKSVGDMRPVQVTVTKAQFREAVALVSNVQPSS